MAFENVGSVVNATFTGGFTTADRSAGVTVKVTGGSSDGFPRPTVAKTDAATDVIAGVVQSVEVASTGNRAPSGINGISYANSGTVKVRKNAAPSTADIGGQIIPTTGAGMVDVDAAAPAVGFGLVVGITGTAATDFLIVDLNAAAQNRA